MAVTTVRSAQIKDGSVGRADMDITTTGAAVNTKTLNGTGISIASTGVDAGTGDVTVNLVVPVTIANGGTGQAAKTAAFDALSPLTTLGDLAWYNGTNTVRLAKGTGLQVLRMNSGATAVEWGDGLQEIAEASTTPVVDTTSTAVGVATLRLFDFFTLPSTEKFYRITGIEWKNGTVVAGGVTSGVCLVDASPPVGATTLLVALGKLIGQAGVSSIQRNSTIKSGMIPGGTICGVFIQSDTTTSTFKTITLGSAANNRKTVTFINGGNEKNQENDVWVSSTVKAYIKVYYKGYR